MRSADKGWQPEAPPLQGRGLGWGMSSDTLDDLHAKARANRRNPTEPEKRLWRHLSNSQLGGFKFRRQEVIGRHIADFACPAKGLVVELDGLTHSDRLADERRADAMARFGYRTVRFTNDDIIGNMDGVLTSLLAACKAAPDRRHSPHPNPSPEGEGLEG